MEPIILHSDMKKPDATTVITPENFRETTWRLPVSDLLYVGPATTRKLAQFGIHTIGALAQAETDFLYSLLGRLACIYRTESPVCTEY